MDLHPLQTRSDRRFCDRFNEAIDQAFGEPISVFSDKIDESLNLLLGMLGRVTAEGILPGR